MIIKILVGVIVLGIVLAYLYNVMLFKLRHTYVHKKNYRKIRIINRLKKYNSHSDWYIIFKDINNKRTYVLDNDYFTNNYITYEEYKKLYGTKKKNEKE